MRATCDYAGHPEARACDLPDVANRPFRHISRQDSERILGLCADVPMTCAEMARTLCVTFFPVVRASPRVRRFVRRLQRALRDAGASQLSFHEARDLDRPGKVQEQLVLIAAGDFDEGHLPVDSLQSLRTATIVGVFDGPPPAAVSGAGQNQLDSLVDVFAWNVVQIAIHVTEERWVISTMNGSITAWPLTEPIDRAVADSLIPKMAARILPPRSSEFELRHKAFEPLSAEYSTYMRDFVDSMPLWRRTGRMMSHTSMDKLRFRSAFYRRIVASYLDHRSGMSYGFLSRQIAGDHRPRWCGHEGGEKAVVHILGKAIEVPIPPVWVIMTRSGCDKSRVDPASDLVAIGLSNGRMTLVTPSSSQASSAFKPSYDTRIILAHAVGNAIVAEILNVSRPGSSFAMTLGRNGAALAHWHGTRDDLVAPKGYWTHGGSNPPVSCSAPQAAFYALAGKLGTLEMALLSGAAFQGDIHLEPHHGINVTGPSLVQIAGWVKRQHAVQVGLLQGGSSANL